MSAKTLSAAQCSALRKGTGHPNTLASLVRLELMDDTHTVTRAGRLVRATLGDDGFRPTVDYVAATVRNVSQVNWNAPQTFFPNESGANTLADARPLSHNGSAVSVVWHPMTGKATCLAGDDVIGERDGVEDMTMREAQLWALECVAVKGEHASPTLQPADARTLADDRAARTVAKGGEIAHCELGTHVATIVGYYSNCDGRPVYVCAEHSEFAGDSLRPMPAVPAAPVVMADWERELMESGTVAGTPAVAVTHILPQDVRTGMAILNGGDPDMIVVSVEPTGNLEEDGTAETRITYTVNGREHSGTWFNYPAWCRMPVRTASVTPDDSHTLVYYVETEGRGVYYRCDGCGSIGPRHSFTFRCDPNG